MQMHVNPVLSATLNHKLQRFVSQQLLQNAVALSVSSKSLTLQLAAVPPWWKEPLHAVHLYAVNKDTAAKSNFWMS